MGFRKIKKIAIVIVIIIILESIMPTLTSYASVFDAIGEWLISIFMEAIARLLGDLGDIIISGLQHAFISIEPIRINTTYRIKYSPGIIFSGNVPAFDANFFSPMDSKKSYLYNDNAYEFVQQRNQNGEDILDDIKIGEWKGQQIYLGVDGFDAIGGAIRGAEQHFKLYGEIYTITGMTLYDIISDTNIENLVKSLYVNSTQSTDSIYWSSDFYDKICVNLNNVGLAGVYYNEDTRYDLGSAEINGERYELYYYSIEDFYVELHSVYQGVDEIIVTFYGQGGQIKESKEVLSDEMLELRIKENILKKLMKDTRLDDEDEQEAKTIKKEIIEQISSLITVKKEKVYESSASKVRNSIATWYKVMMEIALVGLLCVLVYISIRMIISSAAEDKARYKKMLSDWAKAVCMVLVLQFIMSLTFTVTGAINDVFKTGIIGEEGEDKLISKIRSDMYNVGYKSLSVFANCVIYLVLIMLTVMFTYQYLKRFIYIAFLMMIAPMIALTYPLDKIKDGQAQAFTMWIREFIFSVLIQPVHLVVYYIILGVSDSLAMENPIYAMVAISFILPAEKFIRKMFGFDKAQATNKIGSALGGAAVMNAINKMGTKGSGGGKSASESTGASSGETNVRTANQGAGDPMDALRGSGGPTPNPQPNPQPNPPRPNPRTTQKPKKLKNKPSTLRGIGHVIGTGGGKALKAIPRGALRVAGGLTLGTVGLAAGIATGEVENAFAGAAGGFVAGKKLTGNIYDGTKNTLKTTGKLFGEGKYGKEEYARRKFDKEFKKSEEYKALIKKYKGQEADIQAFLDVGLTDAKKIGKALENVGDGKYTLKEAMAYMKMANAKGCPNEVLYDPIKFATYLSSNRIDPSNADTIRKGILDFK